MREFSFFRLYHLVRNRLISDLTPIAIGAAIIVGIQLLAFLLSLLTGHPVNGLLGGRDGQALFGLVMVGSFLVSSRAFFEMQSSRSGTDWLLLPATSLEKYLGALISTQVLVPFLAEVGVLLFWMSTHGFSGLPVPSLTLLGVFLVTNLVLMTGSTVFRKWAGLKTAASSVAFLVTIGMLFSVVMVVIVRVTWGTSAFQGMEHLQVFGSDITVNGGGFRPTQGAALEILWLSLLYGATPLAALLFGFFRVTEKEARDAVQ